MKIKTLLLLIGLLLIGHTSFSRNNNRDHVDTANDSTVTDTVIIDYNYGSPNYGKFKLPEDIKYGEFYILKIKGINQNLWKITLNTKDSTIYSELDFPDYGSILTDELSSLISSINDNISLDLLKEMGNLLETNKSDISTQIRKEAKINISSLNSEIQEANTLINEINTLKKDIKNRYISIYDIYYQSLKNESLMNVNQDIDSLNLADFFTRSNTAITEQKKTVRKHQTDYISFSNTNSLSSGKLKSEDAVIKTAYTTMLSVLDTLEKKVNIEAFQEVSKLIAFINTNTTYTSLPIQFKKDLAEVTLKLEPRDNNSNLQEHKTAFVFPTKRKLLFSIAPSFYGSDLFDQRYSIRKEAVNDTTGYRLVKEDHSKIEIGLATLLHVSYQFKDKYDPSIQFVFGPGVSIGEELKPRFLVGGGFSLGKKHSLTINLGGIVGPVDRLSNSANTSEYYNEQPETVTVTQWKWGGFISLGYTFKI